MKQTTLRQRLFPVVLLIALLLGLAASAQAKEIYTGIYGLWAVDNIEQSLLDLSNNKFKLVSGLEGRTYLDKANKYGLKCLVGYNSGLTKEITDNEAKWNDYLTGLKRYVEDLKNHPAVFAWYLVDEPDLRGISIDKIKMLISTVKSIDNSHPVYTVIYGGSGSYRKYLSYFDIIGIEPYLNKNDSGIGIVKDKILKMKKEIKQLKLNKKLWVVLGAFDLRPRTSKTVSTLRKPTASEFSEMVDMAMNENVDGILVWTLAFKNDSKFTDWNLVNDDPTLWNAVKKLPSTINTNK